MLELLILQDEMRRESLELGVKFLYDQIGA